MKAIIAALLILVSVQVATAEPYIPTATTTWTYDTSVPGLIGFKVYLEDTFLCEYTSFTVGAPGVSQSLQISCPAPGAVPGNNNIYITAYIDGYETAKIYPIVAVYLPPVENGTTIFEGMLIIQ